jgi:hypothetical protein
VKKADEDNARFTREFDAMQMREIHEHRRQEDESAAWRERTKDMVIKCPENPKTGWTIFLNEQRVLNPQKRLCDISKEMASVWQAMSNEQKTPYNVKSKLDYERYANEMAALTPDEQKLVRKQRATRGQMYRAKNMEFGSVLSPFMIFSNEKRQSVREANPGAKPPHFAAIISKMWNGLTDEEKKVYSDKRDVLKAEKLFQKLDILRFIKPA